MTKGFICIAQNNKDVDYVRLAYALALSINNTQSKYKNISIITNENLSQKTSSCFEHVIKIENDRAKDNDWKLHNIVDLYDYTPYDETIFIESDMLFLSDISHWWKTLTKRDIWFTTLTKTYLNEASPTNTIYRKEFIQNKLPSIYAGLTYFKKTELAKQVFDLTKIICENWNEVVNEYLYRCPPKVFSTDVAFSLAVKMLGVEQDTTLELSFPYFTHMKTQNQGWLLADYITDEDWSKYINISFDKFNNSLGVKLSSIRQFGILHYHLKEFLTDEMIGILENE